MGNSVFKYYCLLTSIMIKKIIFFVLNLFSILFFAQAPAIQWQNALGGNNSEILWSIEQTTDGGYIFGGYTNSTCCGGIFGDIQEPNLGTFDYWIVKLNNSGNIVWKRKVKAAGFNVGAIVKETTDGGFIVMGRSDADISGDKTENSNGGDDIWILKLNSVGIIVWQNTIGGSGVDGPACINQTADGGYIVGGSSTSNISGDKTENNFGLGYDYWILKLNSSGVIEWQKTIGGNQSDLLSSILATNDGGYIISGISESNISGNKTENSNGLYDYWVVKIDAVGTIQWQNTIGGSDEENGGYLTITNEGDYIIAGTSMSNISGDKTQNSKGLSDYWLIKLAQNGTIIWDKAIGGSGYDDLSSIITTTDGGIALAGNSLSNISGDKTENSRGIDDYWIVRLNNNDEIIWDKTIGGNEHDYILIYGIKQTTDGGFIIGGTSVSPISGDKTDWVGGSDVWIVKLAPENLATNQNTIHNIQIYPNPTSDYVHIPFGQTQEKITVILTNILGQIVSSKTFFKTQMETYIIAGESGIYFLTFENEKREKKTIKVIKQ
jgi:hypothetical protein